MPAEDPVDEFAERVRDARAYLGLSQTEFGKLLGPMQHRGGRPKFVTFKAVSEWERGIRLPRKEARKRLMVIFAQVEAAKVEKENGAAV